MPKQNIEMSQHVRLVGKVDVVFTVSNDVTGKLRELHLSQGGIDWAEQEQEALLRDFLGEARRGAQGIRDRAQGRRLSRWPRTPCSLTWPAGS